MQQSSAAVEIQLEHTPTLQQEEPTDAIRDTRSRIIIQPAPLSICWKTAMHFHICGVSLRPTRGV